MYSRELSGNVQSLRNVAARYKLLLNTKLVATLLRVIDCKTDYDVVNLFLLALYYAIKLFCSESGSSSGGDHLTHGVG